MKYICERNVHYEAFPTDKSLGSSKISCQNICWTPINILERIAHNTRSKTEEHMLIVMEKSTNEEHLSQPLQTNNKQFEIAVTFLTGYNGIFIVTNSNIKFCFLKSITDEDGFIQITIAPCAYEIESLNDIIKRIIIDEDHFTEANYPFTIKPNFSTLRSTK